MMLDQCQQMRKSDMERNQILQNRLDMLEVFFEKALKVKFNLNKFLFYKKISNSEPNSALNNQFELVNQITKLQVLFRK